ncbi:MAG: hypothetical protein M3322_09035 [Actinomycetota bacterium]|nr:hypothetical protein [Actinomycetota bacterium]
MIESAIERARERLADRTGTDAPAAEAALARARAQTEALAQVAADLGAALPERIAHAVREGVQAEAAPVGRQLAEVRGLSAQVIRRLEALEGELAAERHARVDDLEVLVDLVAAGWRALDGRLERLERSLQAAGSAAAANGAARSA